MKIAAQLYTVRDFTKTRLQFEETLAKIADAGYAGVQLSAVACMSGEAPEVSAADARSMLDALGLTCCATHVSWADVTERQDRVVAEHKQLGCSYTAIGSAPDWAFREDLAGFGNLAGDMGAVAAELAGTGIQFGYHNHAVEFQRFEGGRRLFDVLMIDGPKDLCLELDTYWVVHAGVDLVLLIGQLHGRLPVVHVKDKAVFGSEVDFAPIGEGNLDWYKILPAFEAAGTEWLVVEQDTCRRDPFDCLRSSFEFLNRVTNG